ncbi:MAG: CHASE3 domain-containing protein, partial [Ferruginibacter sp.]
MKQKRLQFFDIVFILTTLLLILASVFSYRYISHLNNSADLVDHTNLVKLELEKTLSDVKDAEAGQRGYLLTHDSSFLAPTQVARTTAFQSISKLAELTKDNPSQQQWIENLKNLIIKRLDRLDTVLKNSPNLPAPFDSSILTGKLIMDQLQFQVNALLSEEELLLKIREKNKDRFEILTPLYSLLFSVLAIIIVVFVYSRLRNEIRLRSIAETGEATIHNFFTQVPAMLAILKGREQRFVFANKPYIEMIGNRDIVGKTLADALPELKRQGFDKVLDIVFTTGHPYIGKEAKLILERNGGMNEIYVNFVYQAYFDKAGNVEGIMVFCYDVTEMISTRSKLEELE